jgi:hypothetical protein
MGSLLGFELSPSIISYNGSVTLFLLHPILWVVALGLAWGVKGDIDKLSTATDDSKMLTMAYGGSVTAMPVLAVAHLFLYQTNSTFEPAATALAYGMGFLALACGASLIESSILADNFNTHMFGLLFTGIAFGFVHTSYHAYRAHVGLTPLPK